MAGPEGVHASVVLSDGAVAARGSGSQQLPLLLRLLLPLFPPLLLPLFLPLFLFDEQGHSRRAEYLDLSAYGHMEILLPHLAGLGSTAAS